MKYSLIWLLVIAVLLATCTPKENPLPAQGGTVYVGSADSVLYALNAATGRKKWSFKTGGAVDASPIVAQGIIYFGSRDGIFYALDAETGNKKWQYDTYNSYYSYSKPSISQSPAVANGIVYFGNTITYSGYATGAFYALDGVTGEKKWGRSLGQYKSFYIHPTVANGLVFHGSTGSTRIDNFYAVNPQTGATVWSAYIGGLTSYGLSSKPLVVNKILYLISDGSEGFRTYDALTGKEKWRLAFNNNGSSPCMANEFIYVAGYSSANRTFNFHAINTQTQAIRWSSAINGSISSSPSVVNGLVYVGSSDNNLYALDTETGKVTWKFSSNGPIGSSPAVADGVIYVGSEDKNLYAVDAKTGTKKWAFQTQGTIKSSPCVVDAAGTVHGAFAK